jgi:hypothetical protein
MYYDDFPTDQHNDRRNYYGVSGYPDCRFNGYIDEGGGDTSGTTYARIEPVIAAELLRPAKLRMSLDLTNDGVTGTVTGHIEALEDCPASKVHVVIYEDPGPRTPHVSRYFAVYDIWLTATEAGQTQDVNGTFPIDASWIAADLKAVMFVQNAAGTRIVVGPGPGPDNLNRVAGYSVTNTNSADFTIDAYGPNRYGVNVAVGDLTGDGNAEILTGPGPGAVFGPQVRGFGYDTEQLPGLSYLAYGTNKYGVNVAAGDIDADGVDEILTGPGPGVVFGPHVRAWEYDGTSVSPIGGVSFFAYGTPKFGVNVVAGDIDADGYDEIITGAGPGAVYGPHVRGWNYDGNAITPIGGVSFLAYGTNKFGVNVACGDIDGDGIDEIVTGAGPGAVFGPHVRGWNVDGGAATAISAISFFAWNYQEWGVNVSCGDYDGDGVDEILTAAGPGEAYDAWIRGFDYDGGTIEQTLEFTAYNTPVITHGANVACGTFALD